MKFEDYPINVEEFDSFPDFLKQIRNLPQIRLVKLDYCSLQGFDLIVTAYDYGNKILFSWKRPTADEVYKARSQINMALEMYGYVIVNGIWTVDLLNEVIAV